MLNIAILGAKGLVGLKILNILQERNLPCDNIYLLGKEDSHLNIDNQVHKIYDYLQFDYKKCKIIFSALSEKSAFDLQKIKSDNAIIIDCSPKFRMNPDVSLVIPEINSSEISPKTQIVSSPNCCAIPIALTISPLHKYNPIEEIFVSTYQSVSGAGKKQLNLLKEQKINSENKQPHSPDQIINNIIPEIGSLLENGTTTEEEKVSQEVNKVLKSNIEIYANCVRVPITYGHSINLFIKFTKTIHNIDDLIDILSNSPGLILKNKNNITKYTSVLESINKDYILLSRIRKLSKKILSIWIVSDNLKKGGALNAVQIAEQFIHKL